MAQSGQIQIAQRHYRAGDLKEGFLAIAATDNADVNRQLVEDAKREAVGSLGRGEEGVERLNVVLGSHSR